MKDQTPRPDSYTNSNCGTPVSLYKLVSKLQVGLLPQATYKKSIIINDVDKSVSIVVDEDILAFVVGSLMSNAIYSTSNCCIRVETILKEGNLQIQVRNNGVFIYSSMMHSLGHIADAARKLEGSICLHNEANSGMTVGLAIASRKAA